ncbi:MAG TPA: CYTH domain-containing protein [Rhizomicrobium sp.]|jgi:CYTH domain-containing protein
MPVEIERKFLVSGEGWRKGGAGERYCQGYIVSGNVTVRVRRAGATAMLTIKGRPRGIVRPEFEYPIPVDDAEELLESMCRKPLVEKLRYEVPHAGHIWHVDEFGGKNAGLVLAEIELARDDEAFARPDWIGREVTHEKKYRNSSLGTDWSVPPSDSVPQSAMATAP